MAGSKSTQTRFVRDNHIYYASLRLLFFIITHLLVIGVGIGGAGGGGAMAPPTKWHEEMT